MIIAYDNNKSYLHYQSVNIDGAFHDSALYGLVVYSEGAFMMVRYFFLQHVQLESGLYLILKSSSKPFKLIQDHP